MVYPTPSNNFIMSTEDRHKADIPNQTQPDKSKGLGDTVAKITKAVGIKPCGGCKKRQKKLNRLFPYKEDPNVES